MEKIKKIYSDDPLVHYKGSTVSSERTKAEIDGLLAEYGVKDTLWHWVPEQFDVWVQFGVEEMMEGQMVKGTAKVPCPTIWDRAKPRGRPPTPEHINMRHGLRAMHWFIKTHLETAYAMQSGKIVAFLPYIQAGKDKALKDVILPQLRMYQALEDKGHVNSSFSEAERNAPRIVEYDDPEARK